VRKHDLLQGVRQHRDKNMAYRPRFSIAKLLSTETYPGICKLGEN
jgi:hypothetical protein